VVAAARTGVALGRSGDWLAPGAASAGPRHPITWVFVDGLDETGLTFLWLDEGADSGDILWQRALSIGPDDHAADVYEKMEALGREAIREFLPQLRSGTAPRIAQDAGQATYRRSRTDADRWIDWSWPARRIHNLAKPYVGALTRWDRQDVCVWRSRLSSHSTGGAAPAAVLVAIPEIVVATGEGALELVELDPRIDVAAGGRFGAAP
jgi:methionyl-tRNA formyltransferase